MNLNKAFWNVYAFFYKRTTNFSVAHQGMFKDATEALQVDDGYKVLDAGCGSGDLEYYLLKAKKDICIMGIDFSEEMLRSAQKKYKSHKNINFKKANLNEKLCFNDESFDRIVCVSVLFSLKNVSHTLKEFSRVLKTHGIIVLIEPEPNFNYGKIAQKNFREVGKYNYLAKIKWYSTFILKIPSIVTMYLMNLIMDSWTNKDAYHYYTKGEFIDRIQEAGLQIINSKKTLADQDNLIIAVKRS